MKKNLFFGKKNRPGVGSDLKRSKNGDFFLFLDLRIFSLKLGKNTLFAIGNN